MKILWRLHENELRRTNVKEERRMKNEEWRKKKEERRKWCMKKVINEENVVMTEGWRLEGWRLQDILLYSTVSKSFP